MHREELAPRVCQVVEDSRCAQRFWFLDTGCVVARMPNNHPIKVSIDQACRPIFDFRVPFGTPRFKAGPIRWVYRRMLDGFLGPLGSCQPLQDQGICPIQIGQSGSY